MSAAAQDAARAIVDAMRAAGMPPDESIVDRLVAGGLVRFQVQGDKPRRRKGWAVLWMPTRDGYAPRGQFGWWRAGVREHWEMSGVWQPRTAVQRAEDRREDARLRAARARAVEAAQRATAAQAATLWDRACLPSSEHPYLVKKRLNGEGLRQLDRSLIVPMRDASGALWNLQRIKPDGSKLFLKDGRVKSVMWRCGQPGRTICIGEGMATMAAVRRATGCLVVAAFSGDNLERVARAVRDLWPGRDLVICADDDAHLVEHPQIKRNVGVDYALAAAAAVGARLAMPPRAR